MTPRQPTLPAKPNPTQLGRRFRRQRTAAFVLASVLLVALAVIDRGVGLLPVGDDRHRYDGRSFEVLRVIDGRTLALRVADGDQATTRVQLWGVDLPDEPGPADAFTRQAAQGQPVTLSIQPHRQRADGGGLLAYAQLPDGRDLGAALIEQGLATHNDRWGHDRLADYARLQRQARENRRGQWDR